MNRTIYFNKESQRLIEATNESLSGLVNKAIKAYLSYFNEPKKETEQTVKENKKATEKEVENVATKGNLSIAEILKQNRLKRNNKA